METGAKQSAVDLRDNASRFWRRRPLFWLALAFAAGVWCDAQFAPTLQTLGGLITAVLLGSFAALFLVQRERNSLRTAGVPPAAALCPSSRATLCALSLALACGMLIHAFRARIPPPDDVSRRTSAAPMFVCMTGTIVDVSGGNADRAWWTLKLDALGPGDAEQSPTSGRVRLSLNGQTLDSGVQSTFGEGDRVALRARLEAPPEITLPDSFDTAAWLERQNIRRIGAVFPDSVRRVEDGRWRRPDLALRRLSSALAARIETLMSGLSVSGRTDGSQAALMNALLFGRRERVDASDREAFTISGTAHLLAISGLQIQFLALLLWRLAACLGFSRRRASLAVLLICVAYCALAGSDPPIARATLMIAFYLGATILYRESEPLSVLGAAALCILAFSPLELFNAGFQLSFAAVLALVTLYPVLDGAWTRWRRGVPAGAVSEDWRWLYDMGDAMRKAVFVSLAAWLGTAPIVAWHMGRFATYSLVVNIVAVPLSNACMVAGLVLLAVSILSATLAGVAAWLAFGSIVALQKIIDLFAALPGASLDLPAPVWPLLAVYVAMLVWLWIERGRQALARVGAACAACMMALIAGLFFHDGVPQPCVTILDLQHGRAALVEAPGGRAALIDAGGTGQGGRLAEMLRRRGVRHLSLLTITADEPDAIDGAADLLKHVPVARVILPRDTTPSLARRELERLLSARGIAYGPPELAGELAGPGPVRWDFWDDGPLPGRAVGSRTAISLRVTLPGARVLLVNARSNVALQRLLAQVAASGREMRADMLCVLAGPGGRWPAEVGQVLRQSNCHLVVAGSGDVDDGLGANLAALAEAHGARVYAPRRDGSLRIQADPAVPSLVVVQSFRNGVWTEQR